MFDSPLTIDLTDLGERARRVCNAEDAAGLITELECAKRRIEHALAEVVSIASMQNWHHEDGCSSVASWVRTIVSLPVGDAKRIVRLAEAVRDLPLIGERLAAGRLGVAQATRLAGLHANKRVSALLPGFLPSLVHYAESLPYEDFNTVAIRWEQLADADGAHRDHGAVHEARDANVHAVGHATYIDARMGNLQGALIAEVFEKYLQVELAKDLAQVDAGEGPTSLARTSKQRRADAMYAVFASAADRFSPAPEPLVNILIDQATYERTLQAMESDSKLGSLVSIDENLLDKRCETSGGVALDPVDVVATSLVAQVRRVVMSASGVPVDLGRRSRVFTGGARAASMLRRRRCIWPGCDVLTCEVDHRQPWSEGGSTSVENADPLCRRHNRLKTHGFRTEYDPSLRHTAVRHPDGRRLVPV
jgi:hypothetical protein